MKTVLFIANYFPPMGGSGVQRSVKFVKHLREFGYRPVVITIEEDAARNDEFNSGDDSLCRDVPEDITVIRTHPGDRYGLRAKFARWHVLGLARFILYPWFWERQAMWYGKALKAASEAIEKYQPDLIYTTSSPFTSARVGCALKKRYGLPWVADLRDGYTLADWSWPSRLHHGLCRWVEQRILLKADTVIMNTQAMKSLYHEYFPKLSPRKTVVINNGFDPDDFKFNPEPQPKDKFRITHAGGLHKLGHPGKKPFSWRSLNPFRLLEYGGPREYDKRPRSAYYLFLGVKEAIKRKPELSQDLAIEFYGPVAEPERFKIMSEEMGLASCIHRFGTVPHLQAIAAMRGSNILFLPSERRLDGKKNMHTPGKLYEYLACKRPILVIAGKGDAGEIAVRSGLGIFHLPDDTDGIAKTILNLYKHWQEGEPDGMCPDEEYIQTFERKRLTAKLVDVFKSVLN